MIEKNLIFLFFRKKSFHFYHAPPGRLSDFVMHGVQTVIPKSDRLGIRDIVVKVSLNFKKIWKQKFLNKHRMISETFLSSHNQNIFI